MSEPTPLHICPQAATCPHKSDYFTHCTPHKHQSKCDHASFHCPACVPYENPIDIHEPPKETTPEFRQLDDAFSSIDAMEKEKYLPKPLRDFHDQKLVFKAIDQLFGRAAHPYAVNWVSAQCYVIDRFLRFMAYHGYTLQRTKRFGDKDIHKTVQKCSESQRDIFLAALKNHNCKQEASE